jgi:2-methylcitrate dehydratase
MPAQYEQDRIERDDIQELLQKVNVSPKQAYSDRFPDEMPTKLTVHLKNGENYQIEKSDYEGFHTRPMSWQTVSTKFEELAEPYTSSELRKRIIEMVQNFEKYTVKNLMNVLKNMKYDATT